MEISDGKVSWTKYTRDNILCGHFSLREWHLIVSDIDSDRDWSELLKNNLLINCYILKQCSTNEPIAFLYTKHESLNGKVISLHGGGWKKSFTHTILFYRGFILMVERLLQDKIKVRTSCTKDNIVAYRFIKSIGFVNYKYSGNYCYFWINNQRLRSSKIYNYISKNSI